MKCSLAHKKMIRALTERVFTGAVLRVSQSGRTVCEECYGTIGGADTNPVKATTLFDLASLTKIAATTTCWMMLAAQQPSVVDEPLSRWFPDSPADKRDITPRLLLAHSSGLPAWRPYYLYGDLGSPTELAHTRIFQEPLIYAPGSGSVYSDLGFIVLAAIVERQCGQPLDAVVRDTVFSPLGITEETLFCPRDTSDRIAWTRPDERAGLVNDLNARAMGGVSGHAGLFGTVRGISVLAEEILRSLRSKRSLFDSRITQAFCAKAGFVRESTRTLGFDTPSPEGSSSGRFFSPESLGHTGFTGTSVWIDPRREIIVTLLTNRVFMGEADNRIKALRPILHDAVMEEYESITRV